eukprot:SAG31_NODE_2147_length_6335_cov_2.753849_8_plen_326_part_00
MCAAAHHHGISFGLHPVGTKGSCGRVDVTDPLRKARTMSSRYTVREYGRAGHSSTCWLSIEERGDSWGLLVAEEGASEANEEWLPLSKISTYDVGGQYMSASKTDGNSLVVIMRPQKYGEHFVRREFGTTQAEEIVKRLATLEIQRVKETENNLEGSITAAMLTSIGVLAALESPGSKRSAAQIEKLHNFFKTDIDGEGESWFSELTDMQQSDCCRCFTTMRAKQYKMVVEQGGRADNFYVIAAGSVTILLNGHEIRHRGQGECFGEAELEKLGDKRMSSVSCRLHRWLHPHPFLQHLRAGHGPGRFCFCGAESSRLPSHCRIGA